jgi:DNA-binding Lrp family transcriptional regulator
LDRLDLEILKGLLLNNGVPPGNPILRKSFRSIAKELGVDQGTIRRRMKAFQERRVLRGWYLGTSPGLTGHDVIHAWFEVEDNSAKTHLTEKILNVKGVERACSYLGPKVSLVLLSKKGTDSDMVLNHLKTAAGPGMRLHKQGFIPVPAYRPKASDWAIIASLQRDPWKPYSVVAKEAGVSSRTVKRRVSRLSEDGVIYMLPIIDLKALQGAIPVELVVDYTSPESKAAANERIMPHLREGLVFSDAHGPYGYFALLVTNVSHLEQISKWVRQQEGVRDVSADVLQDVLLNRNRYEDRHLLGSVRILNERVKALPTSMR